MDSLRFLHIPKTAGSTFSKVLRWQYRGVGKFVFKGKRLLDIERFSSLSPEEKRGIGLYTGHAPLFTGVEEADSAPTITILRDPLKRVRSFIQHVSEGKSPHLLEDYPPETFVLDEFLESGYSELSNLQSRMLVNYDEVGGELRINSLTEDEMVETAISNLTDRITCFGLQEQFDYSLVLFARTLGWKTPYYESMNRKNVRKLLTFEQRHLDRIAELNSADIKFYEIAKQKFMDRMAADEQTRREYRAFIKAQKVVSPIMKLYGDTGRFVVRRFRAVTGRSRPVSP